MNKLDDDIIIECYRCKLQAKQGNIMNQDERDDFRLFCEQATDSQLLAIVADERVASEGSSYRCVCAAIAEGIAYSRSLI